MQSFPSVRIIGNNADVSASKQLLGIFIAMSDMTELRAKLEIDGESIVKDRLASGAYGVLTDPMSDVPKVKSWLAEKEGASAAEANSKREAREEETLAVAKEANSIARSASFVASAAASSALEANEIARSNRSLSITAIAIAAIAAVAAIAQAIGTFKG